MNTTLIDIELFELETTRYNHNQQTNVISKRLDKWLMKDPLLISLDKFKSYVLEWGDSDNLQTCFNLGILTLSNENFHIALSL